MKKLLKTLACSAVAALVGASALADYGFYDDSITIGSYTGTFNDWSGSPDSPTDLGVFSDLTVSSVAFNIWSDANDRGGANMYFRVYDANGQVGDDQDIWLGGATRITGDHDFSISYSTPVDLAAATGLTMEEGKTYYVDMWAKSYGDSGDEWYSNNSANYHAKFVYGTPKTYTLVESADDLVVGADYLVVFTEDGVTSALKNEDPDDPLLVLADAAIAENTISTASDAIVWKLNPGNHRGQRVLFNAAGNVYLAATPVGSYDDYQFLADGTDDYAQFTIDTSALPVVTFSSVPYEGSWHMYPFLYRADSVELQTVTFDPNGGTYYDDMLTMKYVKGKEYWGIWKPAAREGYKFLGWFDEDGARVQNGQVITEDDTRTFTAQWVQLQTVTFDANGGTLRGMESKEFRCDGVYAGFAKPVRDGYTFLGWFDEDGQRVKAGDDVTDDAELTLYAHWGQTVRFDAKGGTVRGQASLIRDIAGVYSGFAKPVWDGHTFLGWFDENDQRVQNGEDVTDDGERTLYAHWKEIAAAPASRAKAGARAASTVTDTITAGILAATSTTYTEFSGVDKTKDGINSDAVYAGKNSKNSNGAMQLRISDNSSGIVTTGSGGSAKSVTVVWQTTPGSDSGLYVYGKTSSYSAATDLYDSTKQGTLLGTITSGTAFEITGDYTYIGLKSKKGTIYPSSIAIEWTVASSDQSVTLSPAGPIEAEIGDEVIITATADGFSGDVTWSWTGSGTPDGNRFTVDTTAAVEASTVTATATYGTETASQSVTVTVTAPKHAITIDSTIQNGTVTTDPEGEAAEGSPVEVTASPASGYKLGSITVNGSEITGTTFEMPAEDVTVSATFVEKTGGTVTYTVESKTEVSASGDVPDGSSAAYSQTYGTAKQATAGNSFTLTLSGYEGLKIVGLTLSMRSNGSSGAGNLSVTCGDATIASIETAAFSDATWNGEYSTSYVDVTPSVTATKVDDDVVIQIAATVNSLYCQSYTVEYETVPVVVEPTVTVTASATEVFVGTEVTITATAENFDAPASDLIWEWKVDETLDPTQDGTTFTWTPSAAGTYTVTATATDGDNIDDDSVTITVNNLPTAHEIVVDAGEHGNAYADVETAYEGATVTLTVEPDAGYAVDTLTATEFTSGAAVAVDPDTLTFVMPDDDVYVEVSFKEVVTYTLVESADDVVVGADYVIVASGTGFTEALKNAANGTRIGTEAVTVSGKTIENPSATIIWQLNPGNHRGQRVWYSAAANVYAAAPATEGNNAQLLADGTDDLAQWTIDLSALPEVKIYSVSYDDRYLQRNNTAGYHYFATYSSDQAAPSLYRADSTRLQTVTFDPNGGTYYDDMLTMKYVKGKEYWGIWKPVAREGYKFLGWFDEDGARVQNGQIITEDDTRTFTAQWVQLQTVTFDANGGTLRGMESKEFRCDGVYAGFAKPTRDGYIFMGWFDEDGTRVLNGEAVSDDAERILYAHWGQTVRFDGNGGTVRGQASLIRDIAGEYSGFAKPAREGNYKFLGWFDENDQRVKNGDDVTDDAERWLYAHWTEAVLTIRSFAMKSAGIAARDARIGGGQEVELSLVAVAGVVYEVEWTDSLDGEWTVLKRWTADDDGETSVTVTVPSDSASGFFRITAPMGE